MYSKISAVLLLAFVLLGECGQSVHVPHESNNTKPEKLNWRFMGNATHLPICRDMIIPRTGLACEEWEITTEDGFELNVIHLPPLQKNAKVVFLQHGLLGSAACWFDQLQNESLGYILHHQGYDVWASNSRGNWYSLQNNHVPITSQEFWDMIDYDLMAKYDLPAVTNFITTQTGAQKVAYIGHSQGTTQAFASFSENYNSITDKIAIFVAMAPVTRCNHIEVAALKQLASLGWLIVSAIFGTKSFPPYNMSAVEVLDKLGVKCDTSDETLCENLIYDFSGASTNLVNNSQLAQDLGFDPAGTSMRNMRHWMQQFNYDGFRMFDYGAAGNQQHYHQATPPNYDLSKLTNTKIAIYSGSLDELAVPVDVEWTVSQIPPASIVANKQLPYEHNDFLWAMNAPTILYPEIIALLETHAGNETRSKK